MTREKIIVLDDDPTGAQTVHSCLLLTRWEPHDIRAALLDEAPLFFVLTNTRGMAAQEAAYVIRSVCQAVTMALAMLAAEGHVFTPIFVSRSDSTLRGHYPVETDVLAAALGPFDAHFLIPAFFEGGRFTRNGVHYLQQQGRDIPVHETEFAHDSVFPFHHSYLPDYVEEKTQGRIPANRVETFLLPEIRTGCLPHLLGLENNACCVVDAEKNEDLTAFVVAIRQAVASGKRFLFRSAASLLTAFAQLPPQPIASTEMYRLVRAGKPGAVLIGSHVQKTTEQWERLCQEPHITPIEVDVDACQSDDRAAYTETLLRAAALAHQQGQGIVFYTSRSERRFTDTATRLAFGERVSAFLMELVQGLPASLGFLISKGGITSHEVLHIGLRLSQARLIGQIAPGCSVVCCPSNHPRFPDLPVVIFPGNVGDKETLARVWRRFQVPNV